MNGSTVDRLAAKQEHEHSNAFTVTDTHKPSWDRKTTYTIAPGQKKARDVGGVKEVLYARNKKKESGQRIENFLEIGDIVE